MELKSYLEERRRWVDAFLDQYFQMREEEKRLYGRLYEAMRYSLLAGGKRVRPILALAAYEACITSDLRNADRDRGALAISSSLELIHTYSLIHDDLPAMDNDDLRRGRPTNHKVYGEALAILAGDSLLTEAFFMIGGAPGIPSNIAIEVVRDIADASGARGMAGGQVMDLDAEKRKITYEELEAIHRHKTGRLIEVSVVVGAKLAAVPADSLVAMRHYGESIGLAFQIADDILDVEGGAEEMGKATGGDAKKEKSTYPSLLGLDASKKLAQEFCDKAIHSLEKFDDRAEPLREIARYIVNRKS